ncbi:hypothetical protein KC865_04425 [Candidatus Kaiserbacteria bacterium]|nr:hypothetical protein [Candidatus Kaiserbacteria bacterium]USN92341.1 MAG: hypothetical protein H6782_00805 [Candidatus Nomurabacteria bacterium]
MPDLSNSNSFIPKQGAVKKRRVSSSRQIYVFTIISYVFLFATLLASGGIYFYHDYIEKQMDAEVIKFNEAISGFNEAEMYRVLEFDSRVKQASARLYNSVSLSSVFAILEATTVDTIKISSLDLTREGDSNFLLKASVETDSLDSTIFQRTVYLGETIIESVVIDELNNALFAESGADSAGSDEVVSDKPVSFTAELKIPLSEVPYVVDEYESRPLIITRPVSEGFLEDNNDDI